MLIGLLSDTHVDFPDERLPSHLKRPFSETLPPQIRSAFRGVDLILHAGDILVPSVLDELESIAPVMAAWGDGDLETDLGSDTRMMKGYTLLLDGITLWLMHVKPRYALINPQEESRSIKPSSREPEDLPDVIIFGDSHQATIDHYEEVLLVNPGSATLPRYKPQLGTVALLTINSSKVDAHLVQLE
ncbi:metallophosphoesterase family protein [Chloroflexota bacterium]